MVHEVILPKLGTNIDEGVIQEWRRSEGEAVKKGDVLALVETTKAIFEIEADTDGYLRRIFSMDGAEVKFTEPVALITDEPGEDISAYFERKKEATARSKKHHEKKREELVHGVAPQNPSPRRVAATPAARRLSTELNLELGKVADAFSVSVVDERLVKDFAVMKKVAVYGAGLGAKQAKELLKFHKDLFVVGLFDDNPEVKGAEILGLEVLGGWEEFAGAAARGEVDSIAISLHSEFRRKLMKKIQKEMPFVELVALVDGRAIISEGVVISNGAFIEAGSILGPDTFIGEGVIVDTGAVVSHDCHIGAHSHLSPGCSISGIVKLDENVLVGVGASINSQVTIGRNVVITPGSAVVCDFPDDVVVSGNPARIIGKSFRGA